MSTTGQFNDGRGVGYGGGLYLNAIRGVPSFNHGGATAGYRAFLAHFPVQQVSAAILCNRADANTSALNITVLTGLLPLRDATIPMPSGTAEPRTLDTARLPDYLGTWHSNEVGSSIRIFARGDSLFMERRPGQIGALRALLDDQFDAPGGISLLFERNGNGRVERMVVSVPRVNAMPYVRQVSR
jgi:hypothetical protein